MSLGLNRIQETQHEQNARPLYFFGLLIGAVFGFGFGAANGNIITGTELGALTGVFIGWFIVAPTLKK